jgi:exopolysaccharide biosynthesis polyprenyl glycosylphosphotransferase
MSQLIQVSDLTYARAQTLGRSPSLVPLLVGILVVFDFIISVGSFSLADLAQHGPPLFLWQSGHWLPIGVAPPFKPVWNMLLVVPFVRIGTLWYCQLYRVQGEFSLAQDLIRITKAASLGSVILILVAFVYRGGSELSAYSHSRLLFVLDWGYALYGLLVLHLSLRMVQVVARRQGKNIIPAVIVGDGDMAEMCLEQITDNPRLGYQLVGVLTASSGSGESKKSDLPIIGTIQDLPALIRECGIQEVLITDSKLNPQTLFETIMKCGHTHRVHYHVIPNLFNCLPQKTDIDQIGVLPMVKLFKEPMRGINRYLKRALDLVGVGWLMLMTSPLWLLIAVLIKRESPGPVFYKQERVGMDGHVFMVYKFRSMRADTDDQAHRETVKEMIRGHGGNNGSQDKPLYGKVKDDHRITRVGQWMRRFSVDELPQLINILRGEMSLVGPRPLPIYQVEESSPWHRTRHHIKPGLTGLWQVSGRNRLPFDEMVRLDIYYIEHWSLWLDLKIMLKTPTVMLFGYTEE